MATLGEQAVGSIVKLNVGGVVTEFIVVQQGLPSSAYDDSCNGTWLLMKNIYTERAFGYSNNLFAGSAVFDYLNGDFLALLDREIQDGIIQVKIPYQISANTVSNGANGLSARVFLLSATELGIADAYTLVVGDRLEYFDNDSGNSTRKATYKGNDSNYWTSTGSGSGGINVHYISNYGTRNAAGYAAILGVRPALILPLNYAVDDDGNVIAKKQAKGYIDIKGTKMELTGMGYVGINGVLCQLTSSMVNCRGVLYPMFIGTPAKPSSRLPDGYTELEYIGASGSQYIDMGFKANQNTRVVMDFQATSADNGGSFMFGARTTAGSNAFNAALIGDKQVFYDFGNKYSFANFSNLYDRITVDADKNTAVFKAQSGESVTVSLTVSNFTTPYNLVLGSCNNGGVVYTGAAGFNGKIFSCQAYDNGTLIRDFVPCKNSSGTVGLYDLVNSKFYGNRRICRYG